MRSVLQVCNLHPTKLGAFEQYLAEFGRRCRVDSVRCGLVLSGDPIPAVAELLRAAGVEWWVIPDWNDSADRERARSFVRQYLQVLRNGPWDVAVYQFCHELTVSAATVLARIRRIAPRVAVWVQQSGMVMPSRAGKYLSRLRVLARFVDGMVVLDPAARAAVLARGWRSSRLTVIGNGCPIPSAPRRDWLRSALALPADSVLAIAVGSLIERKGYDVLIPAIAPLLTERLDRHLLVVGEGPLRTELETLARTHGVGSRVHFLGLRSDVPDLLADADLFALASRAEGLSFAVVEALAAALPVVATDVGGHREVISEATGFLVPPGDAMLFRKALANALEDLPAARRRGAAGRELVAQQFSVEKQVDDQFRYCASLAARAAVV